VVPEIFFIENQSVIRLELSAAPTTKAVFTMAEGGQLPETPPFQEMSLSFSGEVLASFYGYCNHTGANTLKLRLDEFIIKAKENVQGLPAKFARIDDPKNALPLSQEQSKLAAFFLSTDPLNTITPTKPVPTVLPLTTAPTTIHQQTSSSSSIKSNIQLVPNSASILSTESNNSMNSQGNKLKINNINLHYSTYRYLFRRSGNRK